MDILVKILFTVILCNQLGTGAHAEDASASSGVGRHTFHERNHNRHHHGARKRQIPPDCHDSSWCVNGVLDSVNCVCNCNTGYTGTLCDQAVKKKRSVEDSEIGSFSHGSSEEHDITDAEIIDNSNFDGIYYPTCYDSSAGMRKYCTIDMEGCRLEINVTKNIELVSPNARAAFMVDVRESYDYQIEPEHCFYIGDVTKSCENDQNVKSTGRVAIDMCEGMHGSMVIDDVRYDVKPVQEGENRQSVHIEVNDNPLPSSVAREFDPDLERSYPWDDVTQTEWTDFGVDTVSSKIRESRRTRVAETDGATMNVELLLTLDYDFYQKHRDSSVTKALSLINQAQSLFFHKSLVDSNIYISLHVINVQVMTSPYLLNLHNLDRWPDISAAYLAYTYNWENRFWIPDDADPDHHDIAVLLSGLPVDGGDDADAMTTYKSCNSGRTSVVRYSTDCHTSALITHTLGLMLGMYYDSQSPVCETYDADDLARNGIMTDPSRLYFTECNRRDVLFYYQDPTVDCFDDSPIAETVIQMMNYPTAADAACARLYELDETYFSLRACPWKYPSNDCTLWCELQHRDALGKQKGKICKQEDEPMPPNSGLKCDKNRICDGSACVCPAGQECGERRKRSASIHPRFYTFHKGRYIDQISADLVCRERVGMLVEIPNAETQALVEDLITGATSYDYFYMGFRRNSVNDDTWEFINGTRVKYFNWESGEPNDNDNECAVFSRDHGYKWLDFSCDGGAGFICQYDCYFEVGWCKHGSISNSTGTTCVCLCDPGWHGDFCEIMDKRGTSTFEEAPTHLNFVDGTAHCSNSARAKLPSISDEEAYNGFIDFLVDNRFLGETYYVDLTLVDGLWVDSNYKTPRKTFWGPGEPLPGKQCVTIGSCDGFVWRSADCAELHRVACEFKCSQTTEDWCKYGDIVLNDGVCECQCHEGAIGKHCDEFDYDDLLNKTILFYEIQRSGYQPPTNRIAWRADAHLTDVGQYGEDLTGGWYDAGNYVKFALTTSENVWKLAWGLIEFKSSYENANQLEWMYDCLKWGVDFLLKMHVEPNTLYAQVGDVSFAKATWQRPENNTEGVRVGLPLNTTHPGSDVAGLTAAALASSYLAFKDKNQTYADELLVHARDVYSFAFNYRAIWSDSLPVLSYVSGSYGDDLTNAAIWMYNATGETQYLQDAEALYNEFQLNFVEPIFSWSKVAVPAQIMLYLHTGNTTYLEKVEGTLDLWFSTYYTPKGLARITENRSLKRSADMSFLALICVHHGIHPQEYFDFAKGQIDFALGSSGRSFVAGYGHNPPEKVHHQASSCPEMHLVCDDEARHSEEPNPHILWGGFVGGPDRYDRFFDHRKNWAQSEAGINVSGLQSAVAALAYFQSHGLWGTW
ncbi:uncharacterized protein [Ptychodera flava]|uniref:uncharacterized protein isoform X2 n=1 Tax=Ptychodera flava TaxID=63121 RepID=UPI003969DBCA